MAVRQGREIVLSPGALAALTPSFHARGGVHGAVEKGSLAGWLAGMARLRNQAREHEKGKTGLASITRGKLSTRSTSRESFSFCILSLPPSYRLSFSQSPSYFRTIYFSDNRFCIPLPMLLFQSFFFLFGFFRVPTLLFASASGRGDW